MKCLALYHVRFEDLGHFGPDLERQGYEIAYAVFAGWLARLGEEGRP